MLLPTASVLAPVSSSAPPLVAAVLSVKVLLVSDAVLAALLNQGERAAVLGAVVVEGARYLPTAWPAL